MVAFPWRKYSKTELLQEYNRLIQKIKAEKESLLIPYKRVGLLCSNFFFQFERLKTASLGNLSCYEYWKNPKNRDKIISFNKSLNRNTEYVQNITFFNHAPSQFSVFLAGMIYKYFDSKKVFDPYAGWGDRCLAAMALNIDYTGIDCNKNLYSPFEKMIKTYPTKSDITIYINKSENTNISKINFDLVLTSPPFWKNGKLLEEYCNTEEDYNTFLDSFIFVIKECLKKPAWVCLYIPKDMYKDVVKYIGRCKKIIKFITPRYINGSKKPYNKDNCIYCFRN